MEWFDLSGAEGEPLDVLARVIQETKQELGVPGNASSDSVYTYGCRCDGCQAAHTDAVRRRRIRASVTDAFGVCSAAVASEPSPPAICSYNPANVPFVMDTIPPSSVNMQTELDPTQNPSGVELQGVPVP